ncbi:F-box/kelch-repeat protein At3g23880-like [Prosopis cineraria]|uniref:F-box/kelch-repeat protein At3g23880-like n=1 Tax=Prosopis cineraria TaxID=364024 RepID=UPI00240FCCAE|nr:F-box/kelch-repeat protein At3g23880-like [Prosopis cineraria]
MDDLPRDLKLEILLYLPIKSLLRLKCTSKSWLSLISDPYFTKLHFKRSSQCPGRIFYPVGSEILSIDFNTSLHEDSAIVKLDLPLLKLHVDVNFILCSCRGFIFLKPRNEPTIFLWNPTTRVYKQVPIPQPHDSILLYGFCYDEFVDDYLIVLASKYKTSDSSFYFLSGFDVFSVRTNSWEKHVFGQLIITSNNSPSIGSISNKAIHWIVRINPSYGEKREELIAFDITKKKLQEIPLPHELEIELLRGIYTLYVHEGCIGLVVSGIFADEIWVMREYGVKSSWTKIFSRPFNGERVYNCIFPLSPTKDGQLVAVYNHRLTKWSEKGELQEHCPYFNQEKIERHSPCCCSDSFYPAAAYVETLLSLP